MAYGGLHTIRAYSNMKNKNEVNRKMVTWLPMDVFGKFNKFAKENTITGLGKFDYGVALGMLLDRSEYYDMYEALEQRMTELEDYVRILGNKNSPSSEKSKRKDRNEVDTFGN